MASASPMKGLNFWRGYIKCRRPEKVVQCMSSSPIHVLVGPLYPRDGCKFFRSRGVAGSLAARIMIIASITGGIVTAASTWTHRMDYHDTKFQGCVL